MSEFTGFEPPPDRSIWASLVDVADPLRLQRLLVDAHLMMAIVRVPDISKQNTLQTADPDWSDFSRVIEAEKRKRRILKVLKESKVVTRAPAIPTPPVALSSKYDPKIGDIVTALGQVGRFEITDVDPDQRSVNLKLVDSEFRRRKIPWLVLSLEKAA